MSDPALALQEAIQLGPDQTSRVALLWRCLVKLAEQLYGAGVDWEAGAAALPCLPAFLERWAGHLVQAEAGGRRARAPDAAVQAVIALHRDTRRLVTAVLAGKPLVESAAAALTTPAPPAHS